VFTQTNREFKWFPLFSKNTYSSHLTQRADLYRLIDLMINTQNDQHNHQKSSCILITYCVLAQPSILAPCSGLQDEKNEFSNLCWVLLNEDTHMLIPFFLLILNCTATKYNFYFVVPFSSPQMLYVYLDLYYVTYAMFSLHGIPFVQVFLTVEIISFLTPFLLCLNFLPGRAS